MRGIWKKWTPKPYSYLALFGGRRPGGGSTHLLLALVVWPSTAHLFRDGAPCQLRVETSLTFGRSWRFFRSYILTFLVICCRSCFAACGRHPSPSIAIVVSLLSSVPNFSCHTRLFYWCPLTHPGPPCTCHIIPLSECYSRVVARTLPCTFVPVHLTPGVPLRSGRSRSRTCTRTRGVSFFAVCWPVQMLFRSYRISYPRRGGG